MNTTQKNLCRLCLKSGNRNIFTYHTTDMAQHILDFLGIEISENDGKPQHICNMCQNTLMLVTELKRVAELSQIKLLEMIDERSSKFEELIHSPYSEFTLKNENISDAEEIDNENCFDSIKLDIKDENFKYENKCGDLKIEKRIPKNNEVIKNRKSKAGKTKFTGICEKCSNVFTGKKKLASHTRLCITQEYLCDICGSSLKSLSRLKSHRLTHSQNYSCSMCSYKTATKYNLDMHIKRHVGQKEIKCPHCPSTFVNTSNLASHQFTHQPPKFICQVCQKRLKSKATLQDHVISRHSEVKGHICPVCSKTFSTRKNFLRHEIKMHQRQRLRQSVVPHKKKLSDS